MCLYSCEHTKKLFSDDVNLPAFGHLGVSCTCEGYTKKDVHVY